jgi:hypothetical protein
LIGAGHSGLGRVADFEYDYQTAVNSFQSALFYLSGEEHAVERVKALARLGIMQFGMDDYTQAYKLLGEALSLDPGGKDHDSIENRVNILSYLCFLDIFKGDPSQAKESAEETARLSILLKRKSARVQAHGLLAMTQYFNNQVQLALHTCQEYMDLAENLQVRFWWSLLDNVSALTYHYTGNLDNGYAEALIILGGQTITGVGGGVCQVSTTLFRTVYFAGYPILERYAHAYRVGYYEQTSGGRDQNLAGLDATVFVPLVDFKFKNDTPYWLLMETYVNSNQSLTWKFYSTKDGRVVNHTTTGPTNTIEAPDPLYRENPELEKGKIEQVDWAAEGATVVVKRTVTRGGVVLYNDTITTVYQPWRAVYEYGPGTEGMPPEKKEE